MPAIWSFSCSLAITRSSLFGLQLGRKTFQNSFYTWVTVSKMSNWNIKSHELLRKMYKAKQSQDRKRLKLVNVLITKETSCWEWQGLVVCPSFKQVRQKNMLFFFLVYYIHVIVYWEHSRRGSLEKILLGKYYFPANFHFACCESQGFYYFVGWWLTAWAWCWHNCPKRCKIFRRPKQAIRPRQNASSSL